MNNVTNAMRFFFFILGSVILLGIWLTGFGVAHWLLYLPVVFFYMATVTGICPGLRFAGMMFPEKTKTTTKTKARRKKR